MESIDLEPAISGELLAVRAGLRLAVAAYLARYKGQSRMHTDSDLRGFLDWCQERGLDPLTVTRPHVELYLRWMQEMRHFKPSTVSRRLSVIAGFYRTCVIDGVLEHSPVDYVRRPSVPPESPTLGLTHLQFEALLTAARESTNDNDFALVAMLGLLGLRIFEATSSSIEDLGEEHGQRVLLLGKRVGVRGTNEPVWAGRAVNYAAKLAQEVDRHEVLVTKRVFDHFQDNDYVMLSCGCTGSVPGGMPSELWTTTTSTKLPDGDNTVYLLRSGWCDTHGDSFCDAIANGQKKRAIAGRVA